MLRNRINPEYLNAAMQRATFKELPDNEGVFASIPGFQGVYANANTVEEARKELVEVLEEWLDVGMRFGDPIPEIDGIALNQS
ncbi:MAG: type II toxin-antitoxin system HicB family antitoxin [Chloroflexota bacterium]|nr:type II toxin-antitoxin system HicB family antitoxin [Chloroflexota bacterium]